VSKPWSTDDLRRWRDGLRFISLPWVADLYRDLGLPCEPATRQVIREWAEAAYVENHERRTSTEPGKSNAGQVRSGLTALAEATSVAVANVVEAWLERHFVSGRLRMILYVWRAVLQRAGGPPGGAYQLIEPPQALGPAVAQLADAPSSAGMATIVAASAPAVSPSDRELGLDMSVDALIAIETGEREETWKSLEQLASSLGPNGRRAALEWARRQAAALDFPPERLGSEYPSANSLDDPEPIRLTGPGYSAD
jgi:hypothetical protein